MGTFVYLDYKATALLRHEILYPLLLQPPNLVAAVIMPTPQPSWSVTGMSLWCFSASLG